MKLASNIIVVSCRAGADTSVMLVLLLLRTTGQSARHYFKRELESQNSRLPLYPSPFSSKYLLKVSPPCVLP